MPTTTTTNVPHIIVERSRAYKYNITMITVMERIDILSGLLKFYGEKYLVPGERRQLSTDIAIRIGYKVLRQPVSQADVRRRVVCPYVHRCRCVIYDFASQWL